MREFAECYSKDDGWMIIARDPHDYKANHWFVYAKLSSLREEEARRIAEGLNATEAKSLDI